MKLKNIFKIENGSALIIAILLVAFLTSTGILLMLVTTTGPKVASNVKLQEMAFNAAEAGFDSAWAVIENYFESQAWTSFEGHYLTTDKDGNNIDTPWINGEVNPYYFRRLSDIEILNALSGLQPEPSTPGLIFNEGTYIPGEEGQNYTYTVFLIDDEAGGGTPDPSDALLVCIGRGPLNTTKRLEVEIYIETQS